MIWKTPHISKIYEALTAIADQRIKLVDANHAQCFSSSKNKYYEVSYDPSTHSIMSNDNSAYFTGSLSYPMIAFLMVKNEIPYNHKLLEPLSNIAWKDINQKFKNNYDQAVEHVLDTLSKKEIDTNIIRSEVNIIYEFTTNLSLNTLGKRIKPPKGY